jgi:hypothetical protein
MAALEAAIAKIFIDVAVSAGVDVVANRAANPIIRGAGRAYKVYSLVSGFEGAYSALRIAAYTDAARLIGQEILVEGGSRALSQALLNISAANYDVHLKAEGYTLTPEYAEAMESPGTLGFWIYHNPNFPVEDLNGFGKPLAAQVSICVARAVRARDIAIELTSYSEANVPRRIHNWEKSTTWADRLNSELGHILWRPVPEIGLGKMSTSASSTYYGVFRRNDAEGYGCIAWANGLRYYGQTRYGGPAGYGAFYFQDNSIYFGKVDGFGRQLGASISAQRDWVYYGEHEGTTPDGYGRRIGYSNGVESVSAFWTKGRLDQAFPTMSDLYRGIATKMDSPHVQALRVDYEHRADEAARSIARVDNSILSHVRSHL